jgi:Uma2 family endonuclease
MATPGLVFPVGDDNLVPDLVWFTRDRLAGSLDDNQHFRIAPDLEVEVLSPGPANELRDLEIKLELYSRRGVQEYWIVDWQSHQVLVHRRDGGELRPVETLGDGQSLTSPLLPDFSCAVSDLWTPPVS